jgi:flagellar hook assembly protein FlgD
VKVYDFAGDFVTTLVNNQAFEAGSAAVSWAGEAEDGSALANGAYMIRVEAFDGAARQATTVKAVIWRE